ncbi:hypothetical protein N7445_007772 [Penicillium cf. griseofulvum]|nr:hypothetical protein N7445_007772 [Penicillium cf. griseofulvum]
MAKSDKPRKPQTPLDQLPIERRLAIVKYDENDCNDAIHGQRLPKTFGHRVHQLCIIRGIRYHHGFAQELRGVTSEFTRALNARDIMSGIIPTISEPDEVPYCIWHPDVPSEDALRSLVQRYPDMIYQAARACAVAGYIDLYKELNPLPEVHVAEEAGYASIQKSSKGSQEIYQHILSQPVKFAIMNDYTRMVDIAGRRVAPLNGDTAVYSSLAARSKYSASEDTFDARPWVTDSNYFNITEDFGIDDHDCEAPKTPDDALALVYTPLPTDLPLINKDSLIYVAAYMGDIDRYARLRRPKMLEDEIGIVIRGIYHNAFFAKWWDTQISEHPYRGGNHGHIRRAINARRIMSNDLSWVTPTTPRHLLPEIIWYPALAAELTYNKLARIQPHMYRACLRACIAANYHSTWDDLLLAPPENVSSFQSPKEPDEPEDSKLWRISRIIAADFWREAEQSRNQYFLQEMLTAVPNKPETGSTRWSDYIDANTLYFPLLNPMLCVDRPVQPSSGEGPYDGIDGCIGDVDCAVFVMDSLGRGFWEEEMKKQNSPYFHLHEIYELLEAVKLK